MATAQQIQSIYQNELGRNADPSGYAFYANLANQGTPLSEIARQISTSPEGIQYDPTGSVTWNANSSATKPSGVNLTQDQADQISQAYRSGDYKTVQSLINQYKATSADLSYYAPNFDQSILESQGISPYGAVNFTNPYIQAAQATAAGNLQGAQAATAANRVNQVTPFGSVNYQQTGTDSQGNPIWTATQTMSPELQGAYQGLASQLAQYNQPFNPNLPSYGINPGETYSDAIMRRLQPQQQQQQERLEVQLANQGVMPGSEAYNRAKTQLAQAQNDQLTSAVVGGFNTGLAANQQAYNQALTNYQLPLNTLGAVKNLTNPTSTYVSPYNQTSTTGTDYLTAYNLQQQNQIAANAAQQAGQNAVTSGLFGLGSSLLGSKAGGNLIEKGIGAIGGLLGGLF